MRKPKNRKLSFARNRASLAKQLRDNLWLFTAFYLRTLARARAANRTAQGGAK